MQLKTPNKDSTWPRASVRYTVEGGGASMHLLRITLIERVAVSTKLESIKILYVWLEKLQKISNGASERRYASLRLSHHVPPMKETNYQLEPGQDHKISYTLFQKITIIASCI